MPLDIRLTCLGRIGIAEQDDVLTALLFDPMRTSGEPSRLTEEAFAQLNAYLSGRLTVFSLPLNSAQTSFQRAVQETLCEIPYGQTRSYREVAMRMGQPTACRAVGNACHRNPLPIFVPCHRIVGSSRPELYSGGAARKRFLLNLERKNRQTPFNPSSPQPFGPLLASN